MVDVAFGKYQLVKSSWMTVHMEIEKYSEKGNIVCSAVIKMKNIFIIIIRKRKMMHY